MRFLLYNIRYGTGHKNRYHLPLPFSGFFKTTTTNFEQIKSFIELVNPDLIGLVEVDGGSYRTKNNCQADQIGDQLGYHTITEVKYAIRSLASKLPLMSNQSNALLSKKTFTDHNVHYFDTGVKRMIIEAHQGSLVIFLVHLSLKYRHRQNQLEQLHQYISELQGKQVLVCGDFNTLWGSRELKLFLAATGLKSANPDNSPSHPSHDPHRQLDFILHSQNITVTDFSIPKIQLSDHMPLVCDFQIGAKEGPAEVM